MQCGASWVSIMGTRMLTMGMCGVDCIVLLRMERIFPESLPVSLNTGMQNGARRLVPRMSSR